MRAAHFAALNREQRSDLARHFQALVTTRSITNLLRVSHEDYRNTPLGTGEGPSRFSPLAAHHPDHRRSFQVPYLAQDLATALHETVIRDRFDLLSERILTASDYSHHIAVNISTTPLQPLSLIDLTEGNAVRFGVPLDVVLYSRHDDGQYFAEFVHTDMPSVQGVLYRSRFTEHRCVAVFDRAIDRLRASSPFPLTSQLVRTALAPWNVNVH